MRNKLNACIHVIMRTFVAPNSLAPIKKTSEVQSFIPPRCILAFKKRDKGDQTKSIDMEMFQYESSSNSDHELHETTSRPKKMKHRK